MTDRERLILIIYWLSVLRLNPPVIGHRATLYCDFLIRWGCGARYWRSDVF